MTKTRISNRLIVSGMAAGFVFRIFAEGSRGIFFFIMNTILPVFLCYLLFQMRALGAGDIKLFSMLGAFISTKQLLKLIIISFVTGSLFGVCKITYLFLFRKYKLGKLTKIHFSPAILMAYILILGGYVWQR